MIAAPSGTAPLGSSLSGIATHRSQVELNSSAYNLCGCGQSSRVIDLLARHSLRLSHPKQTMLRLFICTCKCNHQNGKLVWKDPYSVLQREVSTERSIQVYSFQNRLLLTKPCLNKFTPASHKLYYKIRSQVYFLATPPKILFSKMFHPYNTYTLSSSYLGFSCIS